MSTSTSKQTEQVRAKAVKVSGDTLRVTLEDSREVSLRISEVPWLKWLATATPKQRSNWHLEPDGFAIYWSDLDDGIEVCHLLDLHPLM